MRMNWKILLVLAAGLFWAGAAFSPAQPRRFQPEEQWVPQIADLLREGELELQAYRRDMEKEAQGLYLAEQARLQRIYKQKLRNAELALQEEKKSLARSKRQDVEEALLRLQLQLMLVSLDPKEQEQRLGELADLSTQYQKWLEDEERELERGLAKLREDFAGALQLELERFETDLELALQQEYALFKKGYQAVLERKIARVALSQIGNTKQD